MKLTKISVKGLFGIFDHEIPLNTDDHVTIIHGPNGYGKTAILVMVNAVFMSAYQDLIRTPFKQFTLTFSDGGILSVKKEALTKGADPIRSNKLMIAYQDKKGTKKSYRPVPIAIGEIDFPLSYLEKWVPGLKRVGIDEWIFPPSPEHMTLNDVIARFRKKLPRNLTIRDDRPEWLMKVIDSITLEFIETQRLINIVPVKKRESDRMLLHAITNYSEDVAHAIQATLAEYATLSQSLDRTFPVRLVTGKGFKILTQDQLNKRIKDLEEKRAKLIDVGLLDQDEQIDIKAFMKLDEGSKVALSLYVCDVEQKLGIFDLLLEKIRLFIKIINCRFLYKHISISKIEGFIFTTIHGDMINPTNLSSGEQHEIVLLYKLLFKISPDSLILIDEPELSLHVAWQLQFLSDLEQITYLCDFDVLFATHSPQIIHDRWDLTVELKGPDKD